MREIRCYNYQMENTTQNSIKRTQVNIDLERAKVEWLNSMFDRQLITTERYMQASSLTQVTNIQSPTLHCLISRAIASAIMEDLPMRRRSFHS